MKKLIKSVVWKPFVSDPYLYLGESKILGLPSFQEVDCQQDFPESPMNYASAGVVMDNNLMVCGGYGMTTCRMWTEDGWVETTTGFNRYYTKRFWLFIQTIFKILRFQYSKFRIYNVSSWFIVMRSRIDMGLFPRPKNQIREIRENFEKIYQKIIWGWAWQK